MATRAVVTAVASEKTQGTSMMKVARNQEPAVPKEKTAEELKYEKDLEEYSKMKTLKEFKAEQKVNLDLGL